MSDTGASFSSTALRDTPVGLTNSPYLAGRHSTHNSAKQLLSPVESVSLKQYTVKVHISENVIQYSARYVLQESAVSRFRDWDAHNSVFALKPIHTMQ